MKSPTYAGHHVTYVAHAKEHARVGVQLKCDYLPCDSLHIDVQVVANLQLRNDVIVNMQYCRSAQKRVTVDLCRRLCRERMCWE